MEDQEKMNSLMKIAGVPYLEILEKGGGILSTLKSTRNANEQELIEKNFKKFKTYVRTWCYNC